MSSEAIHFLGLPKKHLKAHISDFSHYHELAIVSGLDATELTLPSNTLWNLMSDPHPKITAKKILDIIEISAVLSINLDSMLGGRGIDLRFMIWDNTSQALEGYTSTRSFSRISDEYIGWFLKEYFLDFDLHEYEVWLQWRRQDANYGALCKDRFILLKALQYTSIPY